MYNFFIRAAAVVLIMMYALNSLSGQEDKGIRIKGKVLDFATKQAVSGAEVHIEGLDGKFTTDNSGTFSETTYLPAGLDWGPFLSKININISIAGYCPFSTDLRPEDYELDSITFQVDFGVIELKAIPDFSFLIEDNKGVVEGAKLNLDGKTFNSDVNGWIKFPVDSLENYKKSHLTVSGSIFHPKQKKYKPKIVTLDWVCKDEGEIEPSREFKLKKKFIYKWLSVPGISITLVGSALAVAFIHIKSREIPLPGIAPDK